jgi:hypothetical protein
VLNPGAYIFSLATLSWVLLQEDRVSEARVQSDEAERLWLEYYPRARMPWGDSLVRLIRAEVLKASGDLDGAREAIVAARDRLLGRADKIGDPALRTAFLESIPENARTLSLADSSSRNDVS